MNNHNKDEKLYEKAQQTIIYFDKGYKNCLQDVVKDKKEHATLSIFF